MKYHFYYNQKTNLIKMFSLDSIQSHGNTIESVLDVNDDDINKLHQDYVKKIVNNTLVFEIPPEDRVKVDLQKQIENAKNLQDIKDILLKII